MGLSDHEAAAGRIEDHGTQHNARGRDRQEAWLARQGRHAGCTTPRHPFSRPTAQSGTCLGGRSTNAARCTSHRSTLHRPTQRAASPNATRCTSHHTALPYPSRNSTFCRASGKPNHNCPLLPASDRQASARLRPPGTHCSTAHSPAPSHRPRPQAFLCSPRQYRNPTK